MNDRLKDAVMGSSVTILQSELEKTFDTYGALSKALRDTSSGLSLTLSNTDLIADTVRRVLEPYWRLGVILEEATTSLQLSTLYEPGGALNRLNEQMTAISEIVHRSLEPLRVLDGLLANVQSSLEGGMKMAETFNRFTEIWQENAAGMYRVGISSRLLAQATSAQVLIHQRQALKFDQVVEKSMLLQGMATIEEELREEATPEGVNAALERLLKYFKNRLAKAKSVLEQQALGNVINFLVLLLAMYAMVAASSSDEELRHTVQDIPKAIAANIEQLRQDSQQAVADSLEEAGVNQGELGVIIRQAVVYEGPERSVQVISRLPVGELIEFGPLDGNWAKVRFYDAVMDTLVQGWVYAKFVRLIER